MLKYTPIGKYGKFLPYIQSLLDIVIIVGVFLIMLSVNGEGTFFTPLTLHSVTWRTVLICAIVAAFASRGCIAVHRRRMMRAEKLFTAGLIIAFGTTLLYAALMMFCGFGHVKFAFFAILFGLQVGLLLLTWFASLFILRRFRRTGRNTRNIVIIGTGQAAVRLSELLTKEQSYGMRILGYFDNRLPSDFSGKFLGHLERLEEFLKNNEVHEIFYASSVEFFPVLYGHAGRRLSV